MLKKGLSAWLLILVSLVIPGLSACQNQSLPAPTKIQNSLSVEGEVSREIWIGSALYPKTSPIAYHLKVKVKNTAISPFIFDEIEASFCPEKGNCLRATSELVEVRKTADQAFLLLPADNLELEFTTNGYTRDLLMDAGNKPLKFSIAFSYKRKVVAGPYYVFLPDIRTLPSYEETRMNKNIKGLPLRFFSEEKNASY